MGQFRQANGRTQVGVKGKGFAQGQQGRAFRLLVGRQGFPFRTADRTEQNGVGFLAGLQRLVGQGHSIHIDGRSPHPLLAELVRNGKLGRHRSQNAERLRHYLRPDPVPRQHCHFELLFFAHKTPFKVADAPGAGKAGPRRRTLTVGSARKSPNAAGLGPKTPGPCHRRTAARPTWQSPCQGRGKRPPRSNRPNDVTDGRAGRCPDLCNRKSLRSSGAVISPNHHLRQ